MNELKRRLAALETAATAAVGMAILHRNRHNDGGYSDVDGVPVEYSAWSVALRPGTQVVMVEHVFGALPGTIFTEPTE